MYIHHSPSGYHSLKGFTVNRRITLPLAALALALTSLSACSGTTDVRPSVPVTAQPAAASPRCQEDDPCWDCRAVGNRICGPASDAEQATAWDVWEYANGAHSLKIDTSRGFRVDYVGSSVEYPRALRDTEVALVGKDLKWYVFRAEPTK
jgi:hypothetical protein